MSEETMKDQKTDNTLLYVLITIGLLAVGVFGMKWLMDTKPEAKKSALESWTPSVKVIPLTEEDYTPVITAEGQVQAAMRTMMISEVAGAVVYISPRLKKGEIIAEGEVILKLDEADYKTQVTSMKSALADAELVLAQEEARAVQAARDWDKLGRGEPASDLVLRKPQIKSAQARIESAQAAIDKAERDLAKTTIKAPYTCMINEKFIEKGAYVNLMSQVAEVVSVDEHELRLPLKLNELGFLGEDSGIGSEVVLESSIGGKFYQWKGKAVRFEGSVDQSTFTMPMVVSVKRDATGNTENTENTEDFPLPPVGLFVKAKLKGMPMGKVFSIPRKAMREGDTVWILAENDVLEIVKVEVIRSERDRIFIRTTADDDAKKLTSGARIITSPIAIPVSGMSLKMEEIAENLPNEL